MNMIQLRVAGNAELELLLVRSWNATGKQTDGAYSNRLK